MGRAVEEHFVVAAVGSLVDLVVVFELAAAVDSAVKVDSVVEVGLTAEDQNYLEEEEEGSGVVGAYDRDIGCSSGSGSQSWVVD